MKRKHLGILLVLSLLLVSCGKETVTASGIPETTTIPTMEITEATIETTTVTETEVPTGPTLNGISLSQYTIIHKNAPKQATALADGIRAVTGTTLPITDYNGQRDGAYLMIGNFTNIPHYGIGHCLLRADGSTIILDGATSGVLTNAADRFLSLIFGEIDTDHYTVNGETHLYRFTDSHHSSHYELISETSETLADGITYLRKSYRNRNGQTANAYMAVIAPERVSGIIATAPTVGSRLDVPTQYNMAEKNGKQVILGINAGFFKLNTTVASEKNHPWGMCITDGNILGEPASTGNYNVWFGITKDGKPAIGDYKAYISQYRGKLQHGVSGSHIILQNGSVQSLTAQKTPDPRTVVAICQDGSVIFLCVDGRSNDSQGATFADTIQMLLDVGLEITCAIALDGGGSTTYVTKNATGIPTVQNVPSDGKPRGIQSALFVTLP